MKKWTALAFVLVFIVALAACGETKEHGEAETESPQPADIETASGIVTHVGTEDTYKLTMEEIEQITEIIENGNWNTEGTADCANDYNFTINGETYSYHSECGTLNDNLNNRSLTATDAEKELINAVLSQYIAEYSVNETINEK